MFHFKIFFLLLTLLPFAFNQPQELIFRSNETNYKIEEASYSSIFKIKYEDMNSRYLRIKVQRDESTTFKYDLIVGRTENDVQTLQDGTHIISGTNDHFIYVPDTIIYHDDNYVSFYLNVVNFDNYTGGNFTLICEEFNYIEITNENDYSFVTPEESNYDTLYFRFNRTKELDEFTFHVINNNCTECEVKLVYVEGVLNFTIDDVVANAFHGGKLYKLKNFLKPFAYRDNQYFVLEYTSPVNTLTTIGVDYPQLDKTITVGTTVYNYIDTSFPDNNCYRIKYNEEQKFKAIVTSTTGIRAYLSDRLSGHVHNKEIKVNINGILSFTKEDLRNNTFLCFAPLQNKTVAYFEARLIDATDLSKPTITLDPLHVGVSYSFELEPEEYQLYQFNLRPSTTDSISLPMYYVIEKSGNIEVSAFSTDSYPDVHYDTESPNNTYNVTGINGHYFNMSVMPEMFTNTWNHEQKMLAVKCKSSNNSTCSFEMMFYYNEVYRPLSIKENIEYIQHAFMMGDGSAKLSFYYSFIIPDDSVDNLYVEIDTKAVLMPIVELSKDETSFNNSQLQIHGTKQVYHITKANATNGINGMYHLTASLNSMQPSVWTVKYYTTPTNTKVKEVTLSGGFIETRSLKAQEQEIIHIRNPYIHSDKPFMTMFTPLKCNVEVSYVSGDSNNTLSYNEYGFIQHFAPSGNDIYTYHIKATSNSTDDCIVYIASTSLNEQASLVMNENTPISFKYNEQLRSLTVITFAISPSLSLALRTNTDKVLDVRQIFKGDTDGQTLMFSKLKNSENVMLSFKEIMMVLMISTDIYYNYFTVSDPSNTNATDFKVDFLVYSMNPGITYLDRSSALIKLDQYGVGSFYYTTVEHNEELDLVFHTEKGFRIATLLARRDTAEEISNAMALSKYALAEEGYIVQHQSNVITLTKNDTNICDNGCYLFFLLAFESEGDLDESNLAESYQRYQFYVNLKSNDKQPITVPLNEYVYGTITNKDINDYFTVVLPTSVKKYAIDFQSEMCSLYRNQGTTKPTSTVNEGYVTGKGINSFTTFEVTVSQQQTFTVVCNDLYNVDQSKYKFRIRTNNEYEYENMEIIPIYTREDVQCKIDNENTFCDFLLRVEVSSNYPAITFHATGDNMNDDLTIYARLIEKDMFMNLSPYDLKNMLPHQEGDNVVSSVQAFIKNHLKVEYPSEIVNYILVSVHSTKRGIITLSHSFNGESTTPFIPDYSSVLMNLVTNQQIYLSNNKSDLISMNVLEGEIAITCARNDKQIITGTHSTFIMSFMENDSGVNKCTFISNKDSIVSLSYTNQLPGSFVSEIQLGVDLKTKMHLKNAPIVLYAKLYQNEDFIYSFKYNYGNSAVLQSFTRTFHINAYIVKYDTIYKMKQNPKMEITEDKIEGEYNMYSGYGSVKINRELIKESEVYVMIVIDLEPGSPYFPTLINCVHALIPSTQAAQPITHDHYHFDSIRTEPHTPSKYMLCKREQSNDISMYVEFLSSNTLINFAVSEQMQNETFENTTSLIEDAVYNEGKTMLKLNPQNDCIYLSVFIDDENITTTTTTETFKYAFKYVLTPKVSETTRETIKDFTDFGVVSKTVEEDGEDHFSLNINATQFELSTLFVVRVFERKSIPENVMIGTMLLPIKPLFEETFTSSNPLTPMFKNLNPNEYVISVVALIETNTEAISSPMIQTFNMLTHVVNMTFNEFDFNRVITTNRNSFNGGSVIGYMNISQHTCEQYKLQVRAKQHFNDSTLLSDKEVFEVSAYFVSKEFISNKYNDPLLQPSTTKHIAKKYSLDHNFIIYMQKSEGDNSEFIFFEITKSDDIMNEYLNDDYLIEVIGYCPAKQPEFSVTENATYVGKIDSNVPKNYYLIDLGVNEFQDFTFELASNFDDNNKTYINYTIEPYENNVKGETIEKVEFVGITYVHVEHMEQQEEQTSQKYLISIFGDIERPEFEYSFKWSKGNSFERIMFMSMSNNLNIEYNITGITLEVTFNNLQQALSLSNAFYYLRMYDNESIIQQLMYLEEDNVKPQVKPIYETKLGYSNQENTTAYLKLPEINGKYFITVSLYARIVDNAEDFKLGYIPLTIYPKLEGLEYTNKFFPLINKFKVVELPDDSDDFTVLGYVTEGINDNVKCGIAFITYDELEPLYHGYSMPLSLYMQFHTVEGTGSVSLKRTNEYTKYMLITLEEAASAQNASVSLIVLPYNNKAYDFMLPTNKYFIDSFMEGNNNHKIYTLTKENQEDQFIEIEFDFMLNENDFNYAIEEYVEGREPTFETNESLILKRIEGTFLQHKIIVNVTNINKLLLSFIGRANSHYEFKYKSYINYSDHISYEYNSEFNVIRYDNINTDSSSYQYPSVGVQIANPFFNQTKENDTIAYYFAIVQYNDNINKTKLESAYLPLNELKTDDEKIYKHTNPIIVQTNTTNQLHELTVQLPYKLKKAYMVCVAILTKGSTFEQTKFVFKSHTFNFNQQKLQNVIFNKEQKLTEIFGKANDEYYTMLSEINDNTIVLAGRSIRVDITYTNLIDNRIIKGYIVDSEYVTQRLNAIAFDPEGEGIEGKIIPNENSINIDFPKFETEPQQPLYIYITVQRKSINDTSSKSFTIYPHLDTNAFVPKMNQHFIKHLYSTRRTITYKVNTEESLYIEYGLEKMNQSLTVVIEELNEEHPELTFTTHTTLNVLEESKGGKNYVIISNSTYTYKPIIYVTFINHEEVDDVLFFVKFDNQHSSEYMETYNGYTSKVEINADLDNSEMTLNFANMMHHLNNIGIYDPYKAEILLYLIDNNETDTILYDSLYMNNNNEHPLFKPKMIRPIVFPDCLDEQCNVETYFKVNKNELLAIKIRVYNKEYSHRFGYELLVHDTTPDYLYQIEPDNLKPFCIDQGFSHLNLYFSVKEGAKKLPSFAFKYFNYKTYRDPGEIPFTIKGYAVDQQFINDKIGNPSQTPDLPANSTEAKYLFRERSAYLSLSSDINVTNAFAYIELRSDSRAIDTICFDVIPSYPDEIPESSFIQDKYFYEPLLEKTVSFKLEAKEGHTYHVIDIIDGNSTNNFEYIVERNKETPSFKEDLNVTRTVEKGRTKLTINTTEAFLRGEYTKARSTINDTVLLLHITKTNNKDGFVLLKHSTFETKETELVVNYDKTVSYERQEEGQLTITFNSIYYNYPNTFKSFKYYIRGYLDTTAISEKDLGSFIIDSGDLKAKPIVSEEFEVNDGVVKVVKSYTLDTQYDENYLLFKVVGESVGKDGSEEKYLYNVAEINPVITDLTLLYIILPIGIVLLIIGVLLIIRKYRKSNIHNNIENNVKNEQQQPLVQL